MRLFCHSQLRMYPQDIVAFPHHYQMKVSCQDVKFGESLGMIELYKLSYLLTRTLYNIP